MNSPVCSLHSSWWVWTESGTVQQDKSKYIPPRFLSQRRQSQKWHGERHEVSSLEFAMRSLCIFQLPRIVWRAAIVQGSHVTLPLFVPTVVGHAPCILCVFYGSDREPSLSGGQRKGLRASVHPLAGLCKPRKLVNIVQCWWLGWVWWTAELLGLVTLVCLLLEKIRKKLNRLILLFICHLWICTFTFQNFKHLVFSNQAQSFLLFNLSSFTRFMLPRDRETDHLYIFPSVSYREQLEMNCYL